jgi:hypothetical protein
MSVFRLRRNTAIGTVITRTEMSDQAVLRDFDTTEPLATLPKGLRPDWVG